MKLLAGPMPPTDRALAYFEAAHSVYQSAAQACGEEITTLRIGGLECQLHFAGPALIDAVMPALAHLPRTAPTPNPALTICLWDRASTGVDLPPRPWSLEHQDSGSEEIPGFNSERFFTIDQQQRTSGVDALHLYDAERRIAIFTCP